MLNKVTVDSESNLFQRRPALCYDEGHTVLDLVTGRKLKPREFSKLARDRAQTQD